MAKIDIDEGEAYQSIYEAAEFYMSNEALRRALYRAETKPERQAYAFVQEKAPSAIGDLSYFGGVEVDAAKLAQYIFEDSMTYVPRARAGKKAYGDPKLSTSALNVLESGYLLGVLEHASELLDTFDERNEKAVEKAAEAPPDALLGQIAFAEERDDAPYEKDTRREKAIYDALVDHVSNRNKPLPKKVVEEIMSLMSQGLYPKILKSPRKKVIYRGMGVSTKWLLDALGVKVLPSEDGSMDASFVYTPKRGWASSWTANRGVAYGFAKGSKNSYSIVLSAASSDNPTGFLDLRGGLYTLDTIRGYDEEDEVIGLGPLNVFKINWMSWIK